MFSEPLAMVRGENRDGVLPEPQPLELVEHEPHVMVDPADLGVVGREALAKALGWLAGLVGIEVVQPQEEGLLRILAQEGEPHFGDLLRGAGAPELQSRGLDGLAGRLRAERIPIPVEALVEPPVAAEHGSRHQGLGGPAARAQRLGEGHLLFGEAVARVRAYAVGVGLLAGEERRVRRQRARRRGDGLLEEQAVGRHGVDARGGGPWLTVRAERIGACRVEGDDDDVQGTLGSAGEQA